MQMKSCIINHIVNSIYGYFGKGISQFINLLSGIHKVNVVQVRVQKYLT